MTPKDKGVWLVLRISAFTVIAVVVLHFAA